MKDKRINDIASYLKQVGMASYDELSQQFHRSKNTIRRDIITLEEKGVLKRTHGGASYHLDDQIIPVLTREESSQQEKHRIGRLASSMIEDGDIIFVDSGTTTTFLLPFLASKHVTIVTANMGIISTAWQLPNVALLSLGGAYCPDTHSFSGVNTVDNLRHINIEKSFLSATCISVQHGLSNNSFLESEIKRAVSKKQTQIIAMLDHTKFDKSAMLSCLPLSGVDVLVTDQKPDEHYQHAFQEYEISCLFPEDTPVTNKGEEDEVSDQNIR